MPANIATPTMYFAATLAIAILTAAAYAAQPAKPPIPPAESADPNPSATNLYARLGKAKSLF